MIDRSVLRRWAAAAADLGVGARCAGCGVPALDWCGQCAQACRPAPRIIVESEVPAVAGQENAGPLGRIIVAWKDQGHLRLTGPLGHLLASACLMIDPIGPITLVPVPTAPAHVRRRGADPVLMLAAAAAGELRQVGVSATAMAVLKRVRATRDQTGLGIHQRQANIAGAFGARRKARSRLNGGDVGSVIVVDDIWTTGASAHESMRALTEHAGVGVDAVAVAAYTPAPAHDRL